jgi:uncharacterized protein YcbX
MATDETVVGRVAELWRFPVKSFQGEPMSEVDVAPTGVVGDRRYALRDTRSGKILSAKRHGVLLEAKAHTNGGEVTFELPDGNEYGAADPGVSEALSAWLGFDVTMEEASADSPNGVYEFAFDIDDSPDAVYYDIDIPPGGFVDLFGAHLLTTASIATVAAQHPDGAWDIRRFRPTALIDTGEAQGYVEDGWIGGTVTLGTAAVAANMPTIRCVMPTRPQPSIDGRPPLERDKTVSKTITAEHGSNLGVYCSIAAPGRIAVGDPVTYRPG